MQLKETELTVKAAIIDIFNNNVIITHFVEDYILLADLVACYNHKYEPKKIKNTLLEYLRTNVTLKNALPPVGINYAKREYSSVVKGKFNKRAYLGIRWKDEKKNQKYYNHFKHMARLSLLYKMSDLIENQRARLNFIATVNEAIKLNRITWNYANSSYYNTILLIEINYKLSKANNLFNKRLDKEEVLLDFSNNLSPYYDGELM